MEARSAGPGRGSEFTVRLPLAGPSDLCVVPAPIPVAEPPSASEVQVARVVPPEPRRETVRRRVLLIDDNKAATEALGMILGYWGHTVHLCNDGSSGLRAADEFRPDVVLLDIGLPDVDGYAVARALRENRLHRAAVVIAVTGFGRDDDRRRSESAGFDAHLVKPLDLDALERLLGAPTLAIKGRREG